jgi:hypothetical protein
MWFVLFLEYFSDSMFLRFSLAALALEPGRASSHEICEDLRVF